MYKYDPFGRRISKQVGAVITYFVYSDEGLIGEYDASGAPVKAYGWMPDSIWGTNPVFMVENGQYYYYHNDHLGTPQSMTDSTGNVVWSAEYTAFGEATIDAASTITNNLRFPGQYFDEETGLHYNLNRYYDPVTGRYIQVDPIGFGAEDENLYRYVKSNPLNAVDPLGLLEEPGFWWSLVPVVGSGWQALHDFECGNWGWGLFNTFLAATDIFLVRSIGTAVVKVGYKGLVKFGGSHTWKATSKWLSKTGWRQFKGQPMHHWLIPQGGWGKLVPNAIKNQPWNLMAMSSQQFHNALHNMGLLGRVMYGTPTWFKAFVASGPGRVAGGLWDD